MEEATHPPLEDYALIGDCETAALVSRQGSIDWLCFPRFDSPACFARLLGTADHGCWDLAPADPVRRIRRAYRDDSLVLDTVYETETGAVRVTDCMPPRTRQPDIVREVEGLDGRVSMRMLLAVRFDYGSVVPWVHRVDGHVIATAGPDAVQLVTPVELHGENLHTVGRFTVEAGQTVPFRLSWFPSHEAPPPDVDPRAQVVETERWWRRWALRCTYDGPWREAVVRSLITLKALTHTPTGGIVAAPTTSLPEHPGGVRNWDYRYCWLRDASFALTALMTGGYEDEACRWRDWLLRAVAGDPRDIQAVYGVAGERRLPESELAWLPGHRASAPVRVGNAAHGQLQLDVFGEVMDALHRAREREMDADANAWAIQKALLGWAEKIWDQPDEGIWEVRGGRRRFTHSRLMTWVAFDRAVQAVERFSLDGPVERWRRVRAAIADDLLARGYDPARQMFVQYYGARRTDASLLMMPLVGFLPADDPRVAGTVRAVQRELQDRMGFVRRYDPTPEVDGCPPGEGTFLACSFWMVDTLVRQGRHDDAVDLFERLLAVRNDVGLLAEQYDPETERQVGNLPQALSHMALINTAGVLARTAAARGEGSHG